MAEETVQNYRVFLGSEFSRHPPGCLENSDPKNSDPLGVSKSQTRKTQTLRIYKFRQRVPRITTNCLAYCSSIPESAEEIKRLAVENHAYTDHENNGRDPFNQNFRKFRSKTQWIGSVQPEKFRKNGSTF